MPLYEYECASCGKRFELIQRFSDPPAESCPTCGGVVRKLLSSPAIQFKGTGWYITDYARKGKSEPAKGEGASSGGSDKSPPASESPSGPSAPPTGGKTS
jgi:putative FmdB family regulatory protein